MTKDDLIEWAEQEWLNSYSPKFPELRADDYTWPWFWLILAEAVPWSASQSDAG